MPANPQKGRSPEVEQWQSKFGSKILHVRKVDQDKARELMARLGLKPTQQDKYQAIARSLAEHRQAAIATLEAAPAWQPLPPATTKGEHPCPTKN